MDFNNQIETEDCGMCDSTTYYSIEDVYQAFKERLLEEMKLESRVLQLEQRFNQHECFISSNIEFLIKQRLDKIKELKDDGSKDRQGRDASTDERQKSNKLPVK